MIMSKKYQVYILIQPNNINILILKEFGAKLNKNLEVIFQVLFISKGDYNYLINQFLCKYKCYSIIISI